MELKKNILKLLVRLEEAEPQYAMVSPEDEGDMCLTLEHLASLRVSLVFISNFPFKFSNCWMYFFFQ